MDLAGKTHDFLSQKLLPGFGRLHRLARPSRRHATLAYLEGERFRSRASAWDIYQKRDWMLERLRFVVRRAATHTAYYRDLFKRIGFDPEAEFDFDEYAKLPILEREDVAGAASTLISAEVSVEELRKDSTGGSTGMPTVVWKGPEERGWEESGGEFFRRQIGIPIGTRTAYLWGHHLDLVKTDNLIERWYAFETNVRWFDCFRLSAELLENYHRHFTSWRPACIVAYASALRVLAEYLHDRGYRPNYPTHSLITGAEKLFANHRRTIEEVFQLPVHERYGSREVGSIGFQLEPERSLDYSIDWANFLLEPVSGDAEADIIVTKLHADGMPLLRYRIGDVGRFPIGSMPGHPTFTLHEVLGRATDRIWLPDGQWIDGIQFPHLMKDYPVREFVCLQHPDYSVEIKVVPREGFGDESRSEIVNMVRKNLPGLNVSLILVDSIPRNAANKWRPVITNVSHSQAR